MIEVVRRLQLLGAKERGPEFTLMVNEDRREVEITMPQGCSDFVGKDPLDPSRLSRTRATTQMETSDSFLADFYFIAWYARKPF